VFYTADAWLHSRGGGTPAERAALAACVRAPHLPPRYLAAVAAQSGWFTDCVPPGELFQAVQHGLVPPADRHEPRELSRQEREEDAAQYRRAVAAAGPAFAARASWRAPRRPPSELDHDCMAFAWGVSLGELRALHAGAAALGRGPRGRGAAGGAGAGGGGGAPPLLPSLESRLYHFAGLTWSMRLAALPPAGADGGVRFTLKVKAELPPTSVVAGAPPAVVSADLAFLQMQTAVVITAGGAEAEAEAEAPLPAPTPTGSAAWAALLGSEPAEGAEGASGGAGGGGAAAGDSQEGGGETITFQDVQYQESSRYSWRYGGDAGHWATGQWRPGPDEAILDAPGGEAGEGWDDAWWVEQGVASDGEVKVAVRIMNVW
jgi:hypothetical protein